MTNSIKEKTDIDKDSFSRRDFIKKSAAGAGIGLGSLYLSRCEKPIPSSPPPPPVAAEPLETVRIGFIGVGLQGSSHVRNLLRIEGAEIRAVCDIVEDKVRRIQDWVEKAGRPRPEGYSRGETDFKRLCARDDLDLVITATPWKWHVPVCVAAMETGKHAATEVPAAVTLDECWQLVETAEKTRRHCVMLENCCYSNRALLTLNMVRKGLLGELVHGRGGYLHDLSGIKFSGEHEGLWRPQHSMERDGDLYPTHGLGPIAECMNINRGDRFDHMVSMSSKTRGLNAYAVDNFGPDSPEARIQFALGDVVTSLIRTANGCTVTLIHDTNLPRPYSRIDLIQGVKGIIQGYPDRVYIEGRSPAHRWEEMKGYMEEFQHPLWRQIGDLAKGAGHGGMDFLEDYRLINALLTGRQPDMDVYDAAAWSAVSGLSEISVAGKSKTVDFPDFTRGAWKTNKPIFITDMD
ncbi:MAG: Gfo/Idh/MocA family protein [Candidatus Aminicenantaceae bacterium]